MNNSPNTGAKTPVVRAVSIDRKLFPFQETVLEKASKLTHPALFLAMRLGKSLITVRLCRERWKARRVLIVAPLTVLGSWEDEFKLEGMQVGRVHRTTDPDLMFKAGGFYLVGYERLLRMPRLTQLPWDAVVLDESTRCKNPQAKITKLCTRGFRNARHRVILSGLPAPESPLDYCTQFVFLHGTFCGCKNYWGFRQRYFKEYFYDWRPRNGAIDTIKKAVHSNAIVLSRKDAGIGEKKVYSVRRIPLNAKQETLIRSIRNGFELSPQERTSYTVVCTSWLARVAGGHGEGWELVNDGKANELLNLLTGELKDEPVVVFFRFLAELRLCFKRIKAQRISVSWICGSVDPEDRATRRRDFQNGKIQILLVQVQTGKFGLNLSRASTAIYYSNEYSLECRAQSEDRIVHPQKKEPLLYIDLVSEGSIDEEVRDALLSKKFESQFFLKNILANFLQRKGYSCQAIS